MPSAESGSISADPMESMVDSNVRLNQNNAMMPQPSAESASPNPMQPAIDANIRWLTERGMMPPGMVEPDHTDLAAGRAASIKNEPPP